MKKIIIPLIAIMLLAIPVLAVPENITTGPYRISFDLGISKEAYLIEIKEPKQEESLGGHISTEYIIQITNKTGITHLLQIGLTKSVEATPVPTAEELRQILLYIAYNNKKLKNVVSATRIIDGSNGAIVSADFSTLALDYTTKTFVAMFYPTIDSSHLSCLIISCYPWDAGTLQLLKTIHIEKVK